MMSQGLIAEESYPHIILKETNIHCEPAPVGRTSDRVVLIEKVIRE